MTEGYPWGRPSWPQKGRYSMCVALPVRLVKVEGQRGIGELGGSTVKMRLDLLPEAEVGDYVLVHAGFAIQQVDEEEAQETLRLLQAIQWER